jgi:predicted nucleic acid-binding protein
MLVDTSVWIDHLRWGDAGLIALLTRAEVECHPFIIGELACGRLTRRAEILALLNTLPQTPLGEHAEVLTFVEANKLAGAGIGWVDAHLLASAALAETPLWTRDRALAAVARRLGLFGEP